MKKEEKEFYDYAAYYGISDFSDLSIAEVATLQFLARFTIPVIRHELYTQIKQFIEFQEDHSMLNAFSRTSENHSKYYEWIKKKKTFSTSSFYNSLDVLAERGLLQFNKSETKKRLKIEPTKFTNYIPKLLLKFLINNIVLNREEDRLISSLKYFQEGKRVLSIWFSEYIVFSIVEKLAKTVEKLYILPKNESPLDVNVMKKEKIIVTNIDNQKIREPENDYDAVIVPVYKKNPKFHGMTRKQILDEIIRVTKPNGFICLITLSDLPSTNNPYADELINLYRLLMNNRIFQITELKDDMTNANLNNIEVHEEQGLLIGTGFNGSN
ncbi:MAG: hypothetical protein ACFFBP_10955 [Promethearchaeota archaeon]